MHILICTYLEGLKKKKKDLTQLMLPGTPMWVPFFLPVWRFTFSQPTMLGLPPHQAKPCLFLPNLWLKGPGKTSHLQSSTEHVPVPFYVWCFVFQYLIHSFLPIEVENLAYSP